MDVVAADLLEPGSLAPVLADMGAAYYLVHSMERPDFMEVDRLAAQTFAVAADRSDLERVVYLGGLGRGELSPHLASRQEVGRVLAAGRVPVTEFRAAVIIGSGSLSFGMTRYLTEVLPVMVTPRWVKTRCQPIAIRDVLTYLVETLQRPATAGRVIEIGGKDVLTYEEMMQGYAVAAGLKRRWILRVPVLSLGLSARWVGLVTPLSNAVAAELVDSLEHEVIVTDRTADELIPVDTMGYEQGAAQAIAQTRGADVPTRWSRGSWRPAAPLPSDPQHACGTIFKDRRTVNSSAPPAAVAQAFMRVGGATGYYSSPWAWKIRGLGDQLFGGVGLRRGRRDPNDVSVGEALDFWRVVHVEAGAQLS